jgi:hypothetical protein
MWAKPKVSLFKNGQFIDPFFMRKIFFFGKKQKTFSPLNDNFFLFFFNIFSIFFEFFFYGHFFCCSDTFFGEFVFEITSFHLRVKQVSLFFKKIPPKKVSEKQKKVSIKKKFEKNGKNI